jgi:signal peptidase I
VGSPTTAAEHHSEQFLGGNMAVFQKTRIREILAGFLCATLICLIVEYVATPMQVVGHSMFPVLQHQDRVVIDKWTYQLWPIRRGDIVVIRQI